MDSDSRVTFKGWYSRGYLPHLDSGNSLQSITFRLADSLPQEKLMQLEHDLVRMPKTEMELERRKAIEQWLDSGMGACLLAHPALAQLVQDTLLRFDGERYRLIAWCVMPNHVHMLIEPMIPLSPIVQSWKSYTGREGRKTAAELGLGAPGLASGRFWMREFWDRFIRNDEHLQQVIRFIHENPVKAGLCAAPAEWRWSSAHPPLGAPSPSSAH